MVCGGVCGGEELGKESEVRDLLNLVVVQDVVAIVWDYEAPLVVLELVTVQVQNLIRIQHEILFQGEI